jgi:putative transposase
VSISSNTKVEPPQGRSAWPLNGGPTKTPRFNLRTTAQQSHCTKVQPSQSGLTRPSYRGKGFNLGHLVTILFNAHFYTWYSFCMTRTTQFAPSEFYHIYNRGVDRREIFLDKRDYRRFLLLLYLSNNLASIHLSDFRYCEESEIYTIEQKKTLVDIGAYCLMPNHFHVLLRENVPNGTSLFMQKLSTGYTMYFNKKYERSGALFQGRFKAEHVGSDPYLRYLFSYIHLNPIGIIESEWKERRVQDISRARDFLNTYEYSSYLDYQKKERLEAAILKTDQFPNYFAKEDVSELMHEVEQWLALARVRQNLKTEPSRIGHLES